MKYNTYNSDKQEISFKLCADTFGSILGAGVHTSVVHLLLKKMPKSIGIKGSESRLLRIANNIRKASIAFTDVALKARIS